MVFRGKIIKKLVQEWSKRGPILKKLREEFFRSATRILDPDQTWNQLREDLKRAESMVLMISPYLNRDPVQKFLSLPELRSALERGVQLKILTKPLDEVGSSKSEHRICIKLLEDSGIQVVQVPRLHFKAAFLDCNNSLSVCYIGSVNLLSVVTVKYIPEDYMLRFESEALVDELASELKGLELKRHLGLEE